MMYSVNSYGKMIKDRVRMDTYLQALKQHIFPGAVVLDIGTGTGIHALMACQLGAEKVYAIEPADAIELARQIAAVNGYSDRIAFFQDLSTNIDLPEPVDVIVSDLHGVLPWFFQHIPSIVDARQRFLKPGGVLLPQGSKVWGAIVEAPELDYKYASPWQDAPYGFDLTPALKVSRNNCTKDRVTPEQLLSARVAWAELDYRTIENPNVNNTFSLTAKRSGTAHGYLLWFDMYVTDDLQLKCSPDYPELMYGSAFFPLAEAVELKPGDALNLNIRADLVSKSQDYVWSWNTTLTRADRSQDPQVKFKQSTFFSELLKLETLRKRASNYVPSLNENGQADLFILTSMKEQHTLEEIAQLVAAKFPNRYKHWHDALERVRELAAYYG
ncbi:MAG: 50S ribosomal protein L11 methyltransferase [Pleurocapsa sp.]